MRSASGNASLTSFLLYNVTETNTDKSEFFNGESRRMQDGIDYVPLSYATINGSTYIWDSTQNLVSGNVNHNTGLLVFDGGLFYPNATYLNTNYGIVNGDFTSIVHAPASEPNYSTATGERTFIRRFKSSNVATLASLSFIFTHTSTLNFNTTDSYVDGTVSGNNVKVEIMISRSNGYNSVWFNPFFSNPSFQDGVGQTLLSVSSTLTNLSMTFGSNDDFRIDNTDIILLRFRGASNIVNGLTSIIISNI